MSREDSIAKLEVYLGTSAIEFDELVAKLLIKTAIIIFVYYLPFPWWTLDQAINSTIDDELDISALDAFCHLIKGEPDLSAAAARLLAGRIQSQIVKESLLALDALEGNQWLRYLSKF